MVTNCLRRTRRIGQPDGFTLLEVMVVLGLIGVMVGIAVPVSNSFIQMSRADSTSVQTTAVFDSARDRAVAERRNFILTFVTPNRIRLDRQEIDAAGNPTGVTTISETILENGQQFVKFVSLPDTPDAFGATSATSFGGTAPVMFTSDGSLVDSSGDVVNGSVFLGVPGRTDTARAVTLFGVTGLSRTWKWSGTQWIE